MRPVTSRPHRKASKPKQGRRPAKMLAALLIAPIVLAAWACSDGILSPGAGLDGVSSSQGDGFALSDDDLALQWPNQVPCEGYNLRLSSNDNTVEWDVPETRVYKNGAWTCEPVDPFWITHFRVQWIVDDRRGGPHWNAWRARGGSVCVPDTEYTLGSDYGWDCGRRSPKTINEFDEYEYYVRVRWIYDHYRWPIRGDWSNVVLVPYSGKD